MDLSDSESDFEIKADLSDLDSDSEEEDKASRRRVARKTQSGTRVISGARKQIPGSRRSGSNRLQTVPDSSENNVLNDAAHVQGKEDSKLGDITGGLCCSCSSWSGCKTKKCTCKAMGGFCGPQCGCNVGRCANRWEIVALDAPAFPGNELMTPAQTEMAAAMAGLRVDSPRVLEQLRTPPISGSILSSGGVKSDGDHSLPSPATERALVKKVVTLLDSAYKESMHLSLNPEDLRESDEMMSLETVDGKRKDSEVGSKRPRRPLSDIGNNKVGIIPECFREQFLITTSAFLCATHPVAHLLALSAIFVGGYAS